jgi:hypothetical protein
MTKSTNALASIELDVTIDGLKNAAFVDFLEANNILFRVIEWQGPGGGNPYVEFSGTRAALEKLIRTHYESGDKEQDDYIVSLIELD